MKTTDKRKKELADKLEPILDQVPMRIAMEGLEFATTNLDAVNGEQRERIMAELEPLTQEGIWFGTLIKERFYRRCLASSQLTEEEKVQFIRRAREVGDLLFQDAMEDTTTVVLDEKSNKKTRKEDYLKAEQESDAKKDASNKEDFLGKIKEVAKEAEKVSEEIIRGEGGGAKAMVDLLTKIFNPPDDCNCPPCRLRRSIGEMGIKPDDDPSEQSEYSNEPSPGCVHIKGGDA